MLAHAKGDMGDIIAVYHATGARTHELIEARVGDYQLNARTLVLGRHKRSRTLREPIPRTITLNADAYAILARRCEGRPADAYIFPNRKRKPYTSVLLDDRFATVPREQASAPPSRSTRSAISGSARCSWRAWTFCSSPEWREPPWR